LPFANTIADEKVGIAKGFGADNRRASQRLNNQLGGDSHDHRCHTHFTTAPPQLQAYRGHQISNLAKPIRFNFQISDEELALDGGTIQTDGGLRYRPAVAFAPSRVDGHHFGSPPVSRYWTERATI
jgi:hypothetical protein